MSAKTDTPPESLICRYCGEELSGPAPAPKHMFVALKRAEDPVSPVNGAQALAGECLNAAGYVTKHDPIGWPKREQV